MHRTVAAAFLILAVTVPLSFAADKQQFSAAIAAVDANLKTPEGKKYEEQMNTEFPQKFLPAFRQCKQSAGSSSGLDMFLKLSAGGKVQEALIHPENPFTTCARAAVAGGQLSAPPHDDYWINIHLQ
ncbi:MAG: hypothetical protein H0X25_02070 [Acidobacteriales bacterium]|nr:hypothetical protein [Terriglobales bacterium]